MDLDERRTALRCAWGVTAILLAEWAALILSIDLKNHPFLLRGLFVLGILDILFYWATAHFIYANHEIEFALLPILLPILIGILLPLSLQAKALHDRKRKHSASMQQRNPMRENANVRFFACFLKTETANEEFCDAPFQFT